MAEYFDPTPGERRDELGKTTIGNTGQKRKNPHRGNDYGGKMITAVTTGRVTKVWWSDEVGNCLEQKTADGLWVTYCHMKNPSARKVGEMVIGGQTSIGLVGNTGSYSFGDHLHIVFSKVPNGLMAAFDKLVDAFKHIDANRPKPIPKTGANSEGSRE
jgi:murein DD-endopeptidase MepM/ murein hydrolase activator NlpD